MADNINNVAPSERDSAAGWIVALIIVLAIVVAAFLWFRTGGPGVPNTGTETNVTVPVNTGASSPASGGTSGGSSGGSTGGSATGGATQ